MNVISGPLDCCHAAGCLSRRAGRWAALCLGATLALASGSAWAEGEGTEDSTSQGSFFTGYEVDFSTQGGSGGSLQAGYRASFLEFWEYEIAGGLSLDPLEWDPQMPWRVFGPSVATRLERNGENFDIDLSAELAFNDLIDAPDFTAATALEARWNWRLSRNWRIKASYDWRGPLDAQELETKHEVIWNVRPGLVARAIWEQEFPDGNPMFEGGLSWRASDTREHFINCGVTGDLVDADLPDMAGEYLETYFCRQRNLFRFDPHRLRLNWQATLHQDGFSPGFEVALDNRWSRKFGETKDVSFDFDASALWLPNAPQQDNWTLGFTAKYGQKIEKLIGYSIQGSVGTRFEPYAAVWRHSLGGEYTGFIALPASYAATLSAEVAQHWGTQPWDTDLEAALGLILPNIAGAVEPELRVGVTAQYHRDEGWRDIAPVLSVNASGEF